VRSTPEAGPLAADAALAPPTWHEHMRGPILGLDEAPPATPPGPSPVGGEDAGVAAREARSSSAADRRADQRARFDDDARADDELRKWPPYSGKPVSEVRWQALRYAAPIASQAEKLTIQAVDLSARGLSRLARYLEERRKERQRDR
jgi:hypothetical protein